MCFFSLFKGLLLLIVSSFLNDINITKMPMYQRAKMGIGYLPQEASVFRKLSVEDNISAVLEMTGIKKPQQKEKLELLLDEFNLQRVRKNNGDTLSGGERRSVICVQHEGELAN